MQIRYVFSRLCIRYTMNLLLVTLNTQEINTAREDYCGTVVILWLQWEYISLVYSHDILILMFWELFCVWRTVLVLWYRGDTLSLFWSLQTYSREEQTWRQLNIQWEYIFYVHSVNFLTFTRFINVLRYCSVDHYLINATWINVFNTINI